MLEGDDLYIELDGEGVRPEAVDASSMLRIATSVVDLVEKLAVEKGREVTFTSLRVVDKCAALAIGPSDPGVVKEVMPDVPRVVIGLRPAPRGAQRSVSDLRSAIRRLPEGYSAKILQLDDERPLTVAALEEPAATSITSFRGRLVKVGGKQPTAHFSTAFQDRVTLELSRSDAMKVGALLYREMDVVARVHYTSELDIKRGRLLEFTPVDESRDSVAELRAWFREASRSADLDIGET